MSDEERIALESEEVQVTELEESDLEDVAGGIADNASGCNGSQCHCTE